ncbi:MAG: ComEA family DNA-binding protein [Planctomycetota bacterium]
MSAQPSRWFQLSGREVRVLVVAAAVVLVFMAGLEIHHRAGGDGDVRVHNAVEMMERPARLDINSAKKYQLQLLPGIGPKTAETVVQDRRARGPYHHLDDLQRVKGIGSKTVERLRPHVMCRPAEPDHNGATSD